MIPAQLPQEMRDLAADLKEAKSADVALRTAYDVLAKKYPGRRLTSYVLPWRLFDHNLDRIWHKHKRIPCTTMNWLLEILLIESGWFKPEQIERKWTTVWLITPHEYLRIHLEDHTLDIDIWGASFHVPYGEHA